MNLLNKFLIFFLLPLNLYSVNFQQTGRSSSLTYEKLEDARTYNAHVRNDHDFIFNLGLSTVDSPLVIKNTSRTNQLLPLIKRMNAIHLGAFLYPKEWLMIGAETAYSQFTDHKGLKGSGFNDIQVRLKLRLLNTERFAFAVMPFINIPSKQGFYTADQIPNFSRVNNLRFSILSDESIGYGGSFIFEYILNWAQIVANIGYQRSSDALIIDNIGDRAIDYREQLITGLGGYIPVNNYWGFNIEWIRKWTKPFFTSAQAQNEVFAGTALGIRKNISAFIGAGLGNLFSDSDGNDLRILAGIKLTNRFRTKKKKPITPVLRSDINKIEIEEKHQVYCQNKKFFGKTNIAVIRFAKNKFNINSKHDQVFAYISKNKHFIESITLEAHASTEPLKSATSPERSLQYNKKLSESRLYSVIRKLLSLGISENAILNKKAFGQNKLVESGYSPEVHNKNRRVEMLITPNENFQSDCLDQSINQK